MQITSRKQTEKHKGGVASGLTVHTRVRPYQISTRVLEGFKRR